MNKEVDIFSSGQTYFEGPAHEFYLFDSESYLDANDFLLSELSEDEIRACIPVEHPSWAWKVIGHFGSKSESVILEPQTGKLYIYSWSRYPINQDCLAHSLNDFLDHFQGLDSDISIWDVM